MRTVKTGTRYYVSSESNGNSSFGQEGYSGYHERWRMQHEGKLPAGEDVYGYAQALEHAGELKSRVYDGRLINANTQFYVITSTVVEVIESVDPAIHAVEGYFKYWLKRREIYKGDVVVFVDEAADLNADQRASLIVKINAYEAEEKERREEVKAEMRKRKPTFKS